MPCPNTLTIAANGRDLTGWITVRVTRGIERFPSDFDVTLTELFPGAPTEVPIKVGDPCQVKLGADLVLTGYIAFPRHIWRRRQLIEFPAVRVR